MGRSTYFAVPGFRDHVGSENNYTRALPLNPVPHDVMHKTVFKVAPDTNRPRGFGPSLPADKWRKGVI